MTVAARTVSWRDGAIVGLIVVVGVVVSWRSGIGSASTCDPPQYVSAQVACDGGSVVVQQAYAGLESDIGKVIERMQAQGRIKRAAVFARPLDGGGAIAVDEHGLFAPASLIKLPVVLAFFRMQVDQPGLLQQELLYDRSVVRHFAIPEQVERSGTRLRLGQRYSVQALMRGSLVDSDNLAYYVLLEYLNYTAPSGPAWFTRTFQELGIVDPRTLDAQTLSARDYTRVLRALYDASLLDVGESELVLCWLAESPYDHGLAAGVAGDVTVANKFGERVLSDGTKQLHDCGIVFLPGHPYAMCVMTHGEDFDDLSAVIRQISKVTFDGISARARPGGYETGLVGMLGAR